ncbi:MAG: polymer-forming cytoskeletal protein [Balneolaceae bacterium]|nr:polymer-forming cytoskeletal protein [Balneolaceae bacterium]
MKSESGKNMPSVNMISEGTHLKGNLKTKNDVRIAGTLEGQAKSKGKLIISSTGKIDGDVRAMDADIAGTLNGEIRVNNKLILRKTAVVDGDIFTKNLLVEEGAQINGVCRMGEQSGPVSINFEDNTYKESTLKAVETR